VGRRHRQIRPPGLFALYVAGYSGYRIFEETIRIDSSTHIFGLRLNFFVALVLALAGIVWFALSQRKGKALTKAAVTVAVGGVITAAAVGCGHPAPRAQAPAPAPVTAHHAAAHGVSRPAAGSGSRPG
jgi:hypothetical protein